jgi:putative nucleotidyltransferase with HDIG domain
MKRILFVDDDQIILKTLDASLTGMKGEWELCFASSGPAALKTLQEAVVDVVVTDLLMPGMDGAQLLTEVARRHPQVVRMVLSGQTDRELALRLIGPAHQYLTKPFHPAQFRTAMTQAFALQDLLMNGEVKRLVSQLQCLPSMPTLYVELLEELRSGEPSMERVGAIIGRDIAMSAKILQLVNSAFFGMSRPVSNAAEAASFLGFSTVKALVLSTQIFSQFNQLERRAFPGFSVQNLWKHCWTAGVFARKIAQAEHLDSEAVEQCFTAGLLHDVGKLILLANLPEQFNRAIIQARQKGIHPVMAEAEVFGCTHAEVGACLLSLWHLPTPIIEAVAFHHHPRQWLGGQFSPVTVTYVADALDYILRCEGDVPVGALVDLDYLQGIGKRKRFEAWWVLCADLEKDDKVEAVA